MRRAGLAAFLLAGIGAALAQTLSHAVGRDMVPDAPSPAARRGNGATRADSDRVDAGIARPPAAEAGTTQGVFPDRLRLPADGADDAPSIRRALVAACGTAAPNLVFQARHYAINSPVTQGCTVNWTGQGWQEQPATPAAAPGTWFDIGPAFNGAATSPITISNSTGTVFRGIGFTEPGQPPPPVPVTRNGQVTGWSPATWAPAGYPPVLTVQGSPGVTVRNVMLLGVNAGLACIGSGRCRFEDIRGQVFTYAINVQQAYDVSRIVDVHVWPYWSAADPVMAYQQANASGILSYRNDTPFWDRLFLFGVRDGVLVAGEAAGTTTGAAIGTLSCDFVQTCLRVDASAGSVSFQAANIRSFGQRWNTLAGAPAAMLPGSAVLGFAGAAVAQVGQMEDFGSDGAVVRFGGSGAAASTLTLNSLYVHAGRMGAGAVEFAYPAGPGNAATLLINVVTPDAPAGFALTNLKAGGTGTLMMPSLSSTR